jgi:hypothetical protein
VISIATFSRLGRLTKLVIVVAGFVAASAIATLAVGAYIASTSGPDRQASSGMFAFGDSLVFLAVFGVAAVPATGAALFFLRPQRAFWRVLSVAAVVIACTALMALALAIVSASAVGNPRLQSWTVIVPLRILAAPLLGLFFLLSGLFAPTRAVRISLLVAAAIEIGAFVSVAFTLLRSNR